MTWDRLAIEEGLDRRTVATREIHEALNLAEAEMERLNREHAAELEVLRKQVEVTEKAAKVIAEEAAEEEQRLVKQLEKVNSQLEPRKELVIRDDVLTVKLSHPGVKKAKIDNYGEETSPGRYWWPLHELESAVTDLRVQGAVDDTQIQVEKDQLVIRIKDMGFLPIRTEPKVVVKEHKHPVNAVAVTLAVLFAIAFVVGLMLR